MTMLAESVDAVIGGDTHRDTHALEMTAPNGTTLATLTITNDTAGFAEALAWTAEHAPGPRIVVGLEGTRSYGIGLARALSTAGIPVVEVECPRRRTRRRGKSDPGDARLAALEVLRMPEHRKALPRSDGDREAIRILLGARHELTVTRTAQINRLRALLLTGTDEDRQWARASMCERTLSAIRRRRGRAGDDVEAQVRRQEARRLAIAIGEGTRALAANKQQLARLVETFAPGLQDVLGVGPVSGGQLVASWSHHGRCRHEAAFAALAGVSPVPASSGRTHRHRLNRGGDRQLNRALHDILLTRWRMCPRTHAYITASRARGKSDPEIRRCLKRYIARELFRVLNACAAH
ncbi:IS110 family RNA-guided transposase [Rhodococcus aetherivorans]|uniref:IS110 family transposase n=1 Tax=Rhodococcus aetherivorans TaxID=191292 RepID=UPI00294A3600|nr:IS110 family transposase [Rhodococcus aetherivorans]MDV6297472.1 IS110 family transposase [Rhodococcus aetherivorans]